MTKKRQKEPISRVDTAWLRMEQPSNLMMITGVITLASKLDYPRLLETIEQRFLVFRRFRQKAVDGSAGAFWEEDEDFDLRSHVRRVALPGKADRQELEYLVDDLASTPLDHARPLWQFHVVENYVEGPVLVIRIHHCIADGVALVQVFLSLTDPSPEPRKSAVKPEKWKSARSTESPIFQRLLEPAAGGLEFVTGMGYKLFEEGLEMLKEPARAYEYLGEAQDVLGELSHALTLANDPDTAFRGRLGPRKRTAWTKPLPLHEVKAVAKAFGCTVNDVLIAAVSGAIRSYFADLPGGSAPEADIRATVPVNLRPLEHALELGNHFGLVFLDLPISVDNPLGRLFTVHERMNKLKTSKQAAVTFGFLAALGMAPAGVQKPVLELLSEKASAVLTNVPGPQEPLYLAGSRMSDMMFWVPQSGSIGVGISILSYNQQVFFGVISDRNLVPEPRAIIERFRQEFENLLYLGLMLPLDGQTRESEADMLLNGQEDEAGDAA